MAWGGRAARGECCEGMLWRADTHGCTTLPCVGFETPADCTVQCQGRPKGLAACKRQVLHFEIVVVFTSCCEASVQLGGTRAGPTLLDLYQSLRVADSPLLLLHSHLRHLLRISTLLRSLRPLLTLLLVSSIVQVPNTTQPPAGYDIHAEIQLEVPVEHGLLIENLLDLAHAPFTHQG